MTAFLRTINNLSALAIIATFVYLLVRDGWAAFAVLPVLLVLLALVGHNLNDLNAPTTDPKDTTDHE